MQKEGEKGGNFVPSRRLVAKMRGNTYKRTAAGGSVNSLASDDEFTILLTKESVNETPERCKVVRKVANFFARPRACSLACLHRFSARKTFFYDSITLRRDRDPTPRAR